MQSTYEYVVQEDTDICHYIGSTELMYGVKSSIIRGYANNDPYFLCHQNVVQKLLGDYPKEDIVFVQVANPGTIFQEYADEPLKLPITLTSYMRLLQFFEKDLAVVVRKMDFDTSKLSSGKDWMRYSDTILIRKAADKLYKKILDVGNAYILYLCVLKDNQNVHISLVYNDETMGQLALPTSTCAKLALDLKTLTTMLDYKDKTNFKRSPQSTTGSSRSQKSDKKSKKSTPSTAQNGV